MKNLKYYENSQNVTQRPELISQCWEMVTIDLLDMGLPQTNLLKNKTKQNSVKHRK